MRTPHPVPLVAGTYGWKLSVCSAESACPLLDSTVPLPCDVAAHTRDGRHKVDLHDSQVSVGFNTPAAILSSVA